MKKLLLSTLLLLTVLSPIFSQIRGSIVDNEKAAVPFVNVLLLNASDSSIVSTGLSAVDGSFLIDNVENGSYILHLSFVGYEKWYSKTFEISVSQPFLELGEIPLKEELVMLDGVVVNAQKVALEQTAEGITMNVQSSMMSTGSNVLQILERAPGVVLDQRNRDLSLNGKSGTLIMINGRPVRMSPSEVIGMLEGMSADNLEKVELLTNPSAKYDADGGAGIINLVTKKKDDEGTNGSASVSVGYGWGQKEAVSINLNHRKGQINYYGTYSFNYDHFFTDFHGVGSQEIPILGGEVNFDFKNNSARKRTSHNATAGFEKEFGNGILLGGNMLYGFSKVRTDIYNDGSYIFQDNSFLHAGINVGGTTIQNNITTILFSEKQLKEDSKISLEVDYIYYDNDAPTKALSEYRDANGNTTYPERDVYANANKGESTTYINIGVLKLDYETRIGSRVMVETGVKGTYSNTTNDAIIESFREGRWLTDDRNKSKLEVNEKIGASYLSLHISFDSLTSLNTGLRYEYWDRDFSEHTLDKRFGKFFPSAFLSRTLSASSSLQIAYNRRISRPDYNDLTNFLRYNDPTSVFTGTPELKPAVSDNIKTGYQFKNKTLSLFYNYERNSIARFQIVENDRSNLVIIAPQNVDFVKAVGVQAHIPFGIRNWWNFTLGGSISRRDFELSYTPLRVSKHYFTYNLYANQDFSLPKNFSIELSGFYNAAEYNGSIAVEGFGALHFGLKKDFRNNHGSLQFTITDLLETAIIRSEYGALTEEAFNSRTSVKFRPESANARIFRISYSRNFGSTKTKGRVQRQTGAQEEKMRIGQ